MNNNSLVTLSAVSCLRTLADRIEAGELTLKNYHCEQGIIDISSVGDRWRTIHPDGSLTLSIEVVGKTEVKP